MEMLDIYNEKREHQGELSREEVHKTGAWHFTVHCWLYDDENIYFAKRSDTHKLYTTASGHVQVKETITEAFSREIKEEIGIDLKYGEAEIIDIVKWQAKKEKNGELNIDNAFAHITILDIENANLNFEFLDDETESVVKINTSKLKDLFSNVLNEIEAYEYIDNNFVKTTINLSDFLVYKEDETPQTKYGDVLSAIIFRQNKMPNKFNLTDEENLFIAKKTLVTNIYNSAKLEGINTTYPETQSILEGTNVPNLKIDEITTILNLRDAWKELTMTIKMPLDLDCILRINSFVSRNESLDPGKIRTGRVGINGVNYIPPIPEERVIKEKILLNSNLSITENAINIMLYIMKTQIFWDGNKRTASLICNKILIDNGAGILSIKDDLILEFNKLLTEFYETDIIIKIQMFLYNKCIFGIE